MVQPAEAWKLVTTALKNEWNMTTPINNRLIGKQIGSLDKLIYSQVSKHFNANTSLHCMNTIRSAPLVILMPSPLLTLTGAATAGALWLKPSLIEARPRAQTLNALGTACLLKALGNIVYEWDTLGGWLYGAANLGLAYKAYQIASEAENKKFLKKAE